MADVNANSGAQHGSSRIISTVRGNWGKGSIVGTAQAYTGKSTDGDMSSLLNAAAAAVEKHRAE